jgi:hypothetical protein
MIEKTNTSKKKILDDSMKTYKNHAKVQNTRWKIIRRDAKKQDHMKRREKTEKNRHTTSKKELLRQRHQTYRYAPNDASDMTFRGVCNMFREIHKTPDVYDVPPDSPSDGILREVVQQPGNGHNALDVCSVIPVKASNA